MTDGRIAALAIAIPLLVFTPSPALAKRKPFTQPELKTWLSYGARVGGPQKASASVLAMRAWEPDESWVVGWFVQAEPGLGGGKISVGRGILFLDQERRWLPPSDAFGVKVSALRTWGAPWGTAAGLTYVGPEADVSVWRVKVTAGWFWRISGRGGRAGVFTWGAGAGF